MGGGVRTLCVLKVMGIGRVRNLLILTPRVSISPDTQICVCWHMQQMLVVGASQ